MAVTQAALMLETSASWGGPSVLVSELTSPVWLSFAILFSFYFVWIFSDLFEWLIKQLFKLIDFISKT